ncbi:LCP family protein [Streptomyces sp. NPDC057638]|uniref:LCP family protein n=1 Tax=Streptomyces sp. NPDC057638 TaxID=3346190 RepID=UPI0036D1EBCC
MSTYGGTAPVHHARTRTEAPPPYTTHAYGTPLPYAIDARGTPGPHQGGNRGRTPRTRTGQRGRTPRMTGGTVSQENARRGGHGGRPRGQRGQGRGKRRILRWAAAVTSVLILGTAAAGYLYYEHLNGKLRRDELTLGGSMPDHKANSRGQTPLNILLIGSDARNSAANQRLGGAKKTFGAAPLADVQMLLHLSADRSHISVVSMPRDTVVRIPECKDPDSGKTYPATERVLTNQSLGRGGPGCTVATWHELTGITIDHFIMIDFAGVVSMADAIGGVPVCVTDNVHSRNAQGEGSGLKLRKGTTYVKGEQALEWLRTRYGFEDGTDLARTKAQQLYMGAMVRELRENTKLTDPNKLRKLAEAAIDAVTVDDGIDSVMRLYEVGEALKTVPTDRITMATMPNAYTDLPGFAGKVVPKEDEAEEVFRMIREDRPLDGKGDPAKKPPASAAPPVSRDPAAPAAEISVMVRNGTGGDGQLAARGRAGEVVSLLHTKGFTRAMADATRTPVPATVVRYSNVELEGDAQAVAKTLGLPPAAVKRSTDVTGIALIVGADWREGAVYPKAAPTTAPTKAPTSANPLNGEAKGCMRVQPGFTWSE